MTSNDDTKTSKCLDCNGVGQYQIQFAERIETGNTCNRCGGSGSIVLPSSIWVFTDPAKPGWISGMCMAVSEELLWEEWQKKYGLAPVAAQAKGLVPSQIDLDKVPAEFLPYEFA